MALKLLTGFLCVLSFPLAACHELDDGHGDGANSREGKPTDIIVMGDSWAEGAHGPAAISEHCAGKTSVNRGVGGSMAMDWGPGGETPACVERKTCTAASAFSDKYGTGYTHAWLSVGGNDWLGTARCNADHKDELVTRVSKAINAVLAVAPSNMKILMTGYGVFSQSPDPDNCPPASTVTLQAAIEEAVLAAPSGRVVFVNVMEAFGGSSSKLSDKKWYGDDIHLNTAGYARMWKLEEIQTFFGCGASGGTSSGSGQLGSLGSSSSNVPANSAVATSVAGAVAGLAAIASIYNMM